MQKVFIGSLLLGFIFSFAQKKPVQEHIIDSVNITKTNNLKNQTSVKQIVEKETIRQAKGNNLADLLAKGSGLGSVQSGATVAKPIIHGLSGSRISLINNGVKLGSQHWGHDHAPEIDPFFAHDVSVVKGAEAIRYGAGAMGGVVLLDAKPLPSEIGFGGDVSLLGEDNSRKFGGGITLQGRHSFLPKWAWRFQANAKQSGNYKTAEYYVYNTGVRERNFNFQTEYRLENHIFEAQYSRLYSKTGIYTGSRTGDLDDFKMKIELGRPYFSDPFSYEIETPYQEVTHQTAKIAWKQRYDFGKIDILYNFQQNNRKEFEARRGELADRPSQDWRLRTHQLNIDFEKNYSDWKTKIGLDLFRQINFNIPGNGVTPVIPNFVTENYAAYFLQTFVKNKWKAEAGLRYDFRFLNLAGYDSFDRYYA
ncbi:MAG: TonB-dependent receptor plug domain-containing protein, partial [Capnocytophaga sp.]|nr:TonB-dependent receptor plug domain-containing protein [Capnocytophaga sp.]